MSADDVIKLFRELGFPAGVAIFVLWRLDAQLARILAALVELRHQLAHRGDDG